MKKKVLLAVLSTIFLFSCATSAHYDNKLNSWIGQPVASLEAKWGNPAHTKVFANGDSIITYIKANDVYVPSEYIIFNQGYSLDNQAQVEPYPSNNYNFMDTETLVGYDMEYTCKTAFLVQGNVITGWKWVGNNCKAY